MEGIKTIKVINDLELEIRGHSATLAAGGLYWRSEIGIAADELPALIAALEKAAEEMGIVTPMGEMAKACKALLEYRRHNTLNFQLEKADHFMNEVEAAMPREAK